MSDHVLHEHFGITATTLKWACIVPVAFQGALLGQVVFISVGTTMKKIGINITACTVLPLEWRLAYS